MARTPPGRAPGYGVRGSELLWSFTQYEHNLYQVFRLYAGIRFLQNTHKPGGRRNLFSSLNYLPPSSQVSHYVSHLIIIFIHLLFFLLALLFIFGYMKLIINYLPPSSQRFATVTGISRSRDTQVYLEQNISSSVQHSSILPTIAADY